ncbi:MAG TPA: hypothetical protein VHO73_06035 [Methylomirabilota bacterium]|nr:hypothetical protein [Methylomirabilota bacterium]
MYSHDAFGLGQLRRSRAIAHALVARHEDLSVLILTGSPIIGRFRFRPRVDFVWLPGIVGLRTGECVSLSLDVDLADTVALRASIIEHTARADALAELPVQPLPTTDRIPGLLGGLSHITAAVGRWRSEGHGPVKDA